MRTDSLAQFLYIPIVLYTIAMLYMTWKFGAQYAVWVIPGPVLFAAVFILSPQIDWWWYQYRPPTLPAGLQRMLVQTHPYFKQLSNEEKSRFATRMALWMKAKEFKVQGMEEVPEDGKAMIAVNAVQLTFGMEDYLLDKVEYFVLYPHPFPSPQHEDWYASEVYLEDKVGIFSLEQLIPGTVEPHRYFNTGLYEFATIFQLTQPTKAFPSVDESIWPYLEQITGMKREAVRNYIGLDDLNLLSIAITFFFTHSTRFAKALPELHRKLSEILNQDPRNGNLPVLVGSGLSIVKTT